MGGHPGHHCGGFSIGDPPGLGPDESVRFFLGRPEALDRIVVEDVAKAAFDLAQRRVGALIIFKRQDVLDDFLKGGVPLDGRVSQEVLSSIFLPQSPTHDGAIAIQGGRIVAMRCYLPLSENPDLPRNTGPATAPGSALRNAPMPSASLFRRNGEKCLWPCGADRAHRQLR